MHNNERLSDNTHIKRCLQCKNCVYWGNDGNPFNNAYDKANCEMYSYPYCKPIEVIDNKMKCEFKLIF